MFLRYLSDRGQGEELPGTAFVSNTGIGPESNGSMRG